MKRKFVCIVCPNSCQVDVEYEGQELKSLHGVECQKGREFIINEIRHPMRVFTGSVRVLNGVVPLVSVKTAAPVPKGDMRELARLTHDMQVDAPIDIGQEVACNVLGKGIQLLATRRVAASPRGNR